MKAFAEMKAEPLDVPALDRWLAGRTSRRILAVPFGGPLPSPHSKAGMDVDGEWFDEDTDLVGAYPVLSQTRERFVDWHHDNDPTGVMKGAVLGHIMLDAEPSKAWVDDVEYEGVWADFWANAGEKRRQLVAKLERQGTLLYGSSFAAPGVRKASTGHIEVWPLIRHTISTSPQNTHAVVPSLKAVLEMPSLDGIPLGALKSLLLGMDNGSASEAAMGWGTAGLTDAQALALSKALDELTAYLVRA